jgi:hypothetical protein
VWHVHVHIWLKYEVHVLRKCCQIRVITKLPNSEQSNKGKVKTHKYINRQNQSTTGKLWKPLWPWLGTGISKEMVGWIKNIGVRFVDVGDDSDS